MTRERIDSLADVMRTLAIARQAHSERMDSLERHVRANEETVTRKLEDLEVASKRECGGMCGYRNLWRWLQSNLCTL